MVIKESAEDYLESIYVLKKQKGNVRSIDVVNYHGVSKPSVSVAMKKLREDGYVTVDEAGFLSLTEKGEAVAGRVYERHQVISEALMALGVDRETALEDSCKIEHVISKESFERLKEFLEKRKGS
ncbi:MAG: metal-dependent transcriptional regulator [Clostridia bacterium]|nr:metal-dependent transcriptional regulator [Clostridia bacterium]MBQ7907825.1 metal-dependent transcriptional regulator [Clostridia bacterium]